MFHQPDVVGLAIAPGALPGNALAPAVPDHSAVAGLSITEHLPVTAGGVQDEQLGVFTASGIHGETEQVSPGLADDTAHGLVEKGQLIAGSAGKGHAMNLAHIPKAGTDKEISSIPAPVQHRGGTRVLIAFQVPFHFFGNGGYVLQHQLAVVEHGGFRHHSPGEQKNSRKGRQGTG